ncbi:molybdopterin-dependent oxidoreductase [Bacillus lacus]|uniref:Molybdopterin-dependent oxidoreductase n=1 Tax=Metabacillus lacus TaxID=1983721 RepID=A0A7X2IWV0_9BACI|nr:molybdopterin-dependent oxidoreductase [Metabacillus lacus]
MSIVKPYLTTRSLVPENQESPISFLRTSAVDSSLFYKRNHFSYPHLSYSSYWIPISGLVETPLLLSMQDILQLPSKTIEVVLECAGNKRSFLRPKVFGEQWEKGAISQGFWKGVPLRTLLQLAGVKQGAKEVVIEGYDAGKRTDIDGVFSYTRSLPIEKALHPDSILAYEYNQKPIPYKHGYPLRLIVPQWYAMASVKWVRQIKVISTAFTGPFQTKDYVYYPHKENDEDAFPVTFMHVNSTIQAPADREILKTGKHTVKGIAWTGIGQVEKVEISLDGGKTWLPAELSPAGDHGYSWRFWTFDWYASEKGEYAILSKATDSNGHTQPNQPYWNRKGYGYHAVDRIVVKVE